MSKALVLRWLFSNGSISPALSSPACVTHRAPHLCPRSYILGDHWAESWLVLSMVCVQEVPWRGGSNDHPTQTREDAQKRWVPPRLSVLQAQCFSASQGSPLDPLLSLPTGNLRFWEARSKITPFPAEASSPPRASTPWDYAADSPALALLQPWEGQGPDPCFLLSGPRGEGSECNVLDHLETR